MEEFYDELNKLKATGDQKAVGEFLLEAVSESGNSGDNVKRAVLLNELAGFYEDEGRFTEAENAFRQALKAYESEGLESTPEYSAVALNYAAAVTLKAGAMFRAGSHFEALGEFRRALDLALGFFGENIEYAQCKISISEVYALLGELPSAITEMSGAVRIMERILGENDRSVKEARTRLEELKAEG